MPKQQISIFLCFNGRAEEALNFYASTLPSASITRLVRYGAGHPMATPAEENFILHAVLSFMNSEIKFLDMTSSYPAPQFNWATSIYVDCKDEAEFDAIFKVLSPNGIVMMGPESVGNIRKVAWVTDKFGVTWQLVWE